MPSSADLAAHVEALLLRGLRPAGNVTRDGRPGSKSAIYRLEDRALSGCEAGVSVGSALWRFAARASGLASGLALAVRPAGSALVGSGDPIDPIAVGEPPGGLQPHSFRPLLFSGAYTRHAAHTACLGHTPRSQPPSRPDLYEFGLVKWAY